LIELRPPWLEHPEIEAGSIGWRMGYGEDYWLRFRDWFLKLPALEQRDFEDRYPEPRNWKKFYALLRGR
jgi:hypothetical protein